jgi:hypothetical protein
MPVAESEVMVRGGFNSGRRGQARLAEKRPAGTEHEKAFRLEIARADG